MPAPITIEQIRSAEAELKAKMAQYPKFAEAVRSGAVKWVVEPGEEMSNLIMVDETDPRYHGDAAFESPQEAEHFTKGFGNEPTNTSPISNFVRGSVMPHSQYRYRDPIRTGEAGPRGKEGELDVIQDALNAPKYVLPLVGATKYASTRLPVIGPAVMAGTVGTGLLNKAISEGRDQGEYGESIPTIIGSGLLGGAAVAANKMLKPENLAKIRLPKAIGTKLNLTPEKVKELGLVGKVEAPLRTKQPEESLYTYQAYDTQPVTDVTERIPDTTPVKYTKPAYPRSPAKEGGINPKIAKKGVLPNWTKKQWIAVARDFLAQNKLPENAYPIEQVIDFLQEAYFTEGSDLNIRFYPKAGAPTDTKETWAAARAGARTKNNEFTYDQLGERAEFEDPKQTEDWRKARAEMKTRKQRKGVSHGKSAIIGPKEYENLKDIALPTPFKRGQERMTISVGTPLRWGATLGLVGAQAALPYVVKYLRNKVGNNE